MTYHNARIDAKGNLVGRLLAKWGRPPTARKAKRIANIVAAINRAYNSDPQYPQATKTRDVLKSKLKVVKGYAKLRGQS
jgi:hypothetical protein